jgi:hypothetical protein
MAWVWVGVLLKSDGDRYNLLLIHATTFFTLAAIAFVMTGKIKPLGWRLPASEMLANLLVVASIGFILLHWRELGGIPAARALGSGDDWEIARFRQSITEHGAVFNYGSGFLIKVVLPLLILRFFVTKQYWGALFVGAVGVTYGLSLMQKSYPIFVIAPSFIYLAFRQRFAAFLCGLAVLVCIAVLVSITNVGLRPNGSFDLQGASAAMTMVVASLAERVFILPGQVVGDWLKAFPAEFPFEHGCGYRVVSSVLGCEFVNNSVLMYRHYFPENVAEGIVGTYNAAHFAEDYANFGPLGLVVSGVLASAVLFAAAWLTGASNAAIMVAVNFPFIAALSSSALHTTLVSGGWLAMVALSLILLPEFHEDANASLIDQPKYSD